MFTYSPHSSPVVIKTDKNFFDKFEIRFRRFQNQYVMQCKNVLSKRFRRWLFSVGLIKVSTCFKTRRDKSSLNRACLFFNNAFRFFRFIVYLPYFFVKAINKGLGKFFTSTNIPKHFPCEKTYKNRDCNSKENKDFVHGVFIKLPGIIQSLHRWIFNDLFDSVHINVFYSIRIREALENKEIISWHSLFTIQLVGHC